MAVRAPPCHAPAGRMPLCRTAPDAGLSFAWHRQRPKTPGSLLARPDESGRPNPSKPQGPGLLLREDSPLYMSAAFMIGFPVALVGLLSTVRCVIPSRPTGECLVLDATAPARHSSRRGPNLSTWPKDCKIPLPTFADWLCGSVRQPDGCMHPQQVLQLRSVRTPERKLSSKWIHYWPILLLAC